MAYDLKVFIANSKIKIGMWSPVNDHPIFSLHGYCSKVLFQTNLLSSSAAH